MINDFLDNLGARQYEKMMEKNATKEKIFYNSESEGKEFKNAFHAPEKWEIWQTSKYDEKFWKDYNKTQNKEDT
jgi:hypothetical protein